MESPTHGSSVPPSDPPPAVPEVASDPPAAPELHNNGSESNGMTDIAMEAERPAPARAPISRQLSVAFVPKVKSGIFGTCCNLLNSIVGAGIIGIPFALSQAGLVAGLLLLALVGYLTDKSLRIIVELASFHPKLKGHAVSSFEDLASLCFGRTGSIFILTNMFVLAYGAMVAYLLIIKDTVPTLFGIDTQTWEREVIMLCTSLAIVVPLSVQRDMASLAFTSLLSVTADVVLVGFVAGYAPIYENVSDAGGFGEVLKNNWIHSTIFIGLGILSTAMACQHSAFIVSGSLHNKTRARWATVTGWSIAVATLLCAIMGVCGFLGFLNETQGDVLNNFESDSTIANAARALLAITMFFTYPMESFVARHVLIKLLHNGDMDGEADQAADDENAESVVNSSRKCECWNRRIQWTLIIYVMALIPALIVDDLGPVLSITGALGGSCIAYIAPGLVYLGINGEEFLGYAAGLLENYRHKHSNKSDADVVVNGEVELPVAGDATRVMPEQQQTTTATLSLDEIKSAKKPWWWYIVGFPIWMRVASMGATTLKEKLAHLDEVEINGDDEEEEEPVSDVVPARVRDYYISMFFVVFGVIAAVAGLASNIYVQINNIFYTPT